MSQIFKTHPLRRAFILSTIMVLLFTVLSPTTALGPLEDGFRVNTYTTNLQGFPSTAMDDNGNFVVVWQSLGQDGNAEGVYGQRFNAAGIALGSEFLVNTITTGQQRVPEAVMDSDGDFVVLWADTGVGVKFQRYNAAGVPQGGETTVGAVSVNPYSIALAIDNDGDFVVVWNKPDEATYARLYNAAGIAQTDEFAVSGGATPSVAMDGAGNFIVTAVVSNNIWAQHYNASGVAQGGTFQVNTSGVTAHPSIAADDSGNFVITWQRSPFVVARRFDASGTALSGEFQVNATLDGNIGNARISMNSFGMFAITWGLGATNLDIYVHRFDSFGRDLGGEIKVSEAANTQDFAIPAMDNEGNFVVAYMSDEVTSGQYDVYARRFSDAMPPEFRVNNIVNRYQALPDVAMDNNGNFVITWRSDLIHGANNGVEARRYNSAAVPQGNQFTVTTITNSFPDFPAIAMSNGSFVIVWAGYEGTGSNDDIFARVFSAAGTPQGAEFRINTTTTGNQTNPAIAMDVNGNFVVVWQTDGSGTPINAQRYNAAGVAQGSEFRVDTLASTGTQYPAVAMDTAGNFVVTWAATVAGNTDVYARRYNAAGEALGTEFPVNTTTTNVQTTPKVAIDANGNFVIVWTSTAVDTGNIYAQRYNAAGVAQAGEFPVNTTTANFQDRPDVAMNSNGDFVVVWATWVASDGEVYAQRYNSDGSILDGEFQVNITTLLPQFMPAAAMDSAGNFVVTWMHELHSTPTPPDDDILARYFSVPVPPSTNITENEFYTAFEQERAAYPAIAQGIADFVPNGINMTVSLNTGEVGRMNFTVSNSEGIVTLQIASITTLSGGTASQNYVTVINRDLAPLIAATLDNLLVSHFGSIQNVESITIDSSTMTLTNHRRLTR